MSRYTDNLLLKRNNMEELESIKEKILNERRAEDIRCSCTHPLVIFPNTHYSYETYKTYKCVKCCAIVEDGYNILYSKVNLEKETKYLLFMFLHNLYISLLCESNGNDTEIVKEIINFYDFLIKQDILKEINSMKREEAEKMLIKSYDLYKNLKNEINNVQKIKTKEELNALSYKTCNG